MSMRFAAFTFFLLASLPRMALAEDASDPFANTALGDPWGMRSALLGKGVDIVVEYKSDTLRNASGGLKRGDSYLDNLDVKFSLDGEKIFGIEGNKSLIYFLNNDGGKPNIRQVGSVQGVSNLEVAKDAPKLYEAWTEQSLFDDKISLLVGLHDLNTEFMVPDITANFSKPAMQIGQVLAQTGRNGPSIFPTTSLAARLAYKPVDELSLSAALFDGVPGNPAHPYDTRIDLEKGDGALLIAEAGWTPKETQTGGETNGNFDKLALGAWSYTRKMNDLVETDSAGRPVKQRSEGVYMISNYQLFNNAAADYSLSVFLRAELGDGDTKPVKWAYETGLIGYGWVPARSDSEIGMGLAQAHNSVKYRESVGGTAVSDEYSMELYYRDTLYRGVRLQPDLQYIINPGTESCIKNATLFGIRSDINFFKQDTDRNNDL